MKFIPINRNYFIFYNKHISNSKCYWTNGILTITQDLSAIVATTQDNKSQKFSNLKTTKAKRFLDFWVNKKILKLMILEDSEEELDLMILKLEEEFMDGTIKELLLNGLFTNGNQLMTDQNGIPLELILSLKASLT